MRKKILPILLAFAFLFSALVIVADDSDADASDELVINGVAIPAGTSYEDPAGRWSYDSPSNILSLNNAVLTELHDDETEKISSIIFNARDDGDSFRIMLNGDSYIQECSSPHQDYKGCGIFCKQHLDIIGEGTLTINTPSYEHGILVNEILYITADAHVEAYSSGASYRVEGIQACFHIEGATVVSEKQVEVLGGFTEGRGMLIDDGGSLTFSTYMGFLDLGNSVQYDNGRLRIKAGGSLNRIEGTSGEQSHPLVRCWNNGGGSRIEINGSMYNAVHDPTVRQNREYVTVPNPEDPSYIGEFKSKVTFDANGGTCSTTSEITQNTGKLDSLPSPDARDGFNFLGWFTEPRLGSGTQITTDTVFPYDATVYAQWRAIHRTVIFDANGGTCGTSSEETNDYGTLGTIPVATRDGYSFAGWYTSTEGGERITKSTVITENKTVYAVWVNTHIIIFDANGGEPDVPFEITDLEGRLRAVPEATRDGYIFAGWYTATEGGEKISKDTVFHTNDTVHAHWVKIYTVKFDANGGGALTKTEHTGIECKLDYLPTAIRVGYHFLGWFTDAEDGDKITTDTVFSSDTTVYAHWVKIYWLVFDANGGTCDAIIAHTEDDGKVHSIPTATRDGYAFRGWYAEPEGGMRVTDNTVLSSNMKVYAYWRESSGDFIKDNALGLEVTGVTFAVALIIVAASFLIVRRK